MGSNDAGIILAAVNSPVLNIPRTRFAPRVVAARDWPDPIGKRPSDQPDFDPKDYTGCTLFSRCYSGKKSIQTYEITMCDGAHLGRQYSPGTESYKSPAGMRQLPTKKGALQHYTVQREPFPYF